MEQERKEGRRNENKDGTRKNANIIAETTRCNSSA